MMLLPPKEGVCPVCAASHQPHEAHNAQSLYYRYRFFRLHDRWPTWADAIAHCSPAVIMVWRCQLEEMGKWSEPLDGKPIAEPPAESIRQTVGDPNSRTFGGAP